MNGQRQCWDERCREVRLRLELGGLNGLDRASRQSVSGGIGGWRQGGGDGLMVRRKVEGAGGGELEYWSSGVTLLRLATGRKSELANSTVLRITIQRTVHIIEP